MAGGNAAKALRALARAEMADDGGTYDLRRAQIYATLAVAEALQALAAGEEAEE